MMHQFRVHTIDSAPAEAKPTLESIEKAYGFLLNLFGVFAEAPALLKGYLTLYEIFGTSSLSAVEQQVVFLAASYENGCGYCIAVHSGAARAAGLSADNLEALRNGTTMPDPKLEALRRFTQKMVQTRGWVEENGVAAFLQAGYSRQQVLEVTLGIGIKTMSNYTNHLADTPLDRVFERHAWQKPAESESAAYDDVLSKAA